jgi:hypothetical protein
MQESIAIAASPSWQRPVTGSYDNEAGPVQMEAVHQALMVYFGTENWLEERNKKMPGIYRFMRTN